jgi:Uma2 family endonuclease
MPDLQSGRPARRYTVEEFQALGDPGGPVRGHAMLFAGEVVEPPYLNHAVCCAITMTRDALSDVFGPRFTIRQRMPLVVGTDTDLVPLIAVVPGSPREMPENPMTAELVVEIQDTSFDPIVRRKTPYYAAAGIADYWVLDQNNNQLIVHRDPRTDSTNPFGAAYSTVTMFAKGQTVAPLAALTANVNVGDLLP